MSQLKRVDLTDSLIIRFSHEMSAADTIECAAACGTLSGDRESTRKQFVANMLRYQLYRRERPDDVKGYALVDQNDSLVAIGGYGTNGVVWFLCTPLVKSYKKSFLDSIKGFMEEAFEFSACLTNIMMWENETHRNFLEHLGADFSLTDTYELSGKKFVRFYLVEK